MKSNELRDYLALGNKDARSMLDPILTSATIQLEWFEKKINQYTSLFVLPLSHFDKVRLYSLRKHYGDLSEDDFIQYVKSSPDWQKFKPL